MMFKGILPSKRIHSGDFTIVAGPGIPGEASVGKENKPDLQAVSQQTTSKAAKSSTKGPSKSGDKQTNGRSKEMGAQKPQSEDDAMKDAFDKLLVSVFPALSRF